MGADEDATHECGGQRFVPVEHHRDAHRKLKEANKSLAAVREALEIIESGRVPPGDCYEGHECPHKMTARAALKDSQTGDDAQKGGASDPTKEEIARFVAKDAERTLALDEQIDRTLHPGIANVKHQPANPAQPESASLFPCCQHRICNPQVCLGHKKRCEVCEPHPRAAPKQDSPHSELPSIQIEEKCEVCQGLRNVFPDSLRVTVYRGCLVRDKPGHELCRECPSCHGTGKKQAERSG